MNPYDTPNATIEAQGSPSRVAWWLYFGVSCVMGMSGIVAFTLAGGGDFPVMALPATIVDVIAVIGLYFYIRRKPLLASLFWKVIALLLALKLLIPGAMMVRSAMASAGLEQRVALLGIAGALWGIPLVYAITRYSTMALMWRSPHEATLEESGAARARDRIDPTF